MIVRHNLVAFGLCMVMALPTLARVNTRVGGFVQNRGQWPAEVLFLHRAQNLDTWITRDGMVIDQYKREGNVRKGHVIRLRWVGSNGQSNALTEQPRSTVTYMAGSDPSQTIATQAYTSVRFANVFDGTGVVYYMDASGQLRYDLDVAPGATADHIAFVIEGDMGLIVDSKDVRLRTTMGGIVMTDLYAYVLGQKATATPVSFEATSNGVRINVPARNLDQPLVIDPVVYGTYLGGSDDDAVEAVAYKNGKVYVAGGSSNVSFPDDVGAYSKDVTGNTDGFVACLSADLGEIISFTYIGGTSVDRISAIDVDNNRKVCVAGNTESKDFPITAGVVGQTHKGQIDVFISRFSEDLKNLEISTYLGGNRDDRARAVKVDQVNGGIVVCGGTNSNSGFPITLAHQSTYGGEWDCFIAKLAAGGGSFLYCTYFGKAGSEQFTALALDAAGSPYVTGSTTSSNFETAPVPGWFSSGRVPYDRTFNGGNTDAFLIKFFPDGSLSRRDDGTFSTYFGGAADEEGRGVYVDALGRPILVGVTTSSGLPTAGSTVYPERIGKQDIFMCLFTDDGKALTGCTYFGGTGDDDVRGMVSDLAQSHGLIWGTTNSTDFPTLGAGASAERLGATDGFIARLNPYNLGFSTIVGSYGADTVRSVAEDAEGDFFHLITGTSIDLPTHTGALEPEPIGGTDGYIGKWANGTLSLVAPVGGESWCTGSNRTIAWGTEGMKETDRFQVLLSSDAGATWSTVASDISSLSYTWKPSTSLESGSNYMIRVQTTRGHVVTSESFTLSSPPSITTQPKNASACEGAPVTLSVEATGANLRYQWRRNGSNITGATSAQYTIPAVNASQSGSYDCMVTGSCSPVATSATANVSVAVATAITTQPQNVSTRVASPFTLSVVAKGSDLTYQWYKNDEPLANGKSATYSVANATTSDAGTYKCTVTGGCGSATSNPVTVIVEPASSVSEDVTSGNTTLRILGPVPAGEQLALMLNMKQGAQVSVRFVSANGQILTSTALGHLSEGRHSLNVDVLSLPSGVYGLEVVAGADVVRTVVQIGR